MIESGGKVFADVEIPDTEVALTMAEFARVISANMSGRHSTQTQATVDLGIDWSTVSALM